MGIARARKVGVVGFALTALTLGLLAPAGASDHEVEIADGGEEEEGEAEAEPAQGAERPAGSAVGEDGKVYVCKYVSVPGERERLKDGLNPIHVNANTLRNIEGLTITDLKINDSWTDAQERSVLVGGPDVSLCVTDDGNGNGGNGNGGNGNGENGGNGNGGNGNGGNGNGDVDDDEPEIGVQDSVVAPAAEVGGACVDGEENLLVTYELDNEASTVDVTYDVQITGLDDLEVEVAAGDSTSGSHVFGPADGAITVTISFGDGPPVTDTFDADDCTSAVLDEAEDAPEPAAPGPERAAQVAAASAALPDTGAPALLLALLGLLSIGLGGALLRPRKRD